MPVTPQHLASLLQQHKWNIWKNCAMLSKFLSISLPMASKLHCKNVLKLFLEKIRKLSILNYVPKLGFCNTQNASILSSFHKCMRNRLSSTSVTSLSQDSHILHNNILIFSSSAWWKFVRSTQLSLLQSRKVQRQVASDFSFPVNPAKCRAASLRHGGSQSIQLRHKHPRVYVVLVTRFSNYSILYAAQ